MQSTPFERRRAIERLRDGLFDPLAVRVLTAREEQMRKLLHRGLTASATRSSHLCVVGPYGSGKSHTLTYLQDRALEAGYAVSLINLDPREIPFHDFRQVYRAVYANLRIPDGPANFPTRWRTKGADIEIPEDLPYLFRATLHAMVQRTLDRAAIQSKVTLGVRAIPSLLERALAGEAVPLQTLRGVLRLRQVPFFDQGNLRQVEPEPWLAMVRGLGTMLMRLGFRGLVVLFDEGESIAQARITQRSRAYALLDQIFRPSQAIPGLFSVFAFTEDFFRQVEAEDFEAVQTRKGGEQPYFATDYAKAWTQLELHRLDDLSTKDWAGISLKLAELHGQAYDWKPQQMPAQQAMLTRLHELSGQQTRLKLKALVEVLDILEQDQLFGTASRTA